MSRAAEESLADLGPTHEYVTRREALLIEALADLLRRVQALEAHTARHDRELAPYVMIGTGGNE